MRILLAFIWLLYVNPEGVLAKQTSTTINFTVKYREFTCNLVPGPGSNLAFGDVNISTLTLDSGPLIESNLSLTCRRSGLPDLTGSNAVTALQSAILRFTSPAVTAGVGGDFLDAGYNAAILPFFNNDRMQFNTNYNLKDLSSPEYNLKFQLVKRSITSELSAGTFSVALNAEVTYI